METVKKCLADSKMEKSSVHDIVLVGGSSRIPKVQQLLKDFFNGKKLCKSINPDEAVAYDAAVQAALLAEGLKNVPNLVLIDVAPLSLGWEIIHGVMSVVIPRNTSILVKKTLEYITIEDSQLEVQINVYEGERKRAADNHFLGSFILSSLPPVARGHPFAVCFEMDQNGILTVSAYEQSTGCKNEITISNDKQRLSTEEIERLVQEAEDYSIEDKKFLRNAKVMNALDHCVYNIKRALKKKEDDLKLSWEEKMKINTAITLATDLLDEEDHQNGISVHVLDDHLKVLQSMLERIIVKTE